MWNIPTEFSFVQPPEADREAAIRVSAFNTVCFSIVVVVVLGIIATFSVFERPGAAGVSLLAITGVTAGSIFLARRGNLRIASAILVFGLWIIWTVQLWLSGAIASVFAGVYVANIALAGVLLGSRVATLVAVLSVSAAFLMCCLHEFGYTIPGYYPLSPWTSWVILLAGVALTLPTINAAMRGFREASREAREEIASRREKEQALRDSQEKLRSVLEASPGAIFLLDTNARVAFANQRTEELFGFECSAIIGTSYFDLVDPGERAASRERFAAHLNGEFEHAAGDRRYITADGRSFIGHVSGRRFYGPDGEVAGVAGIITDISAIKKTEEALRESEHRFRSFVENAGDIVYSLTPEGVFTYISPNWLGFMGEPAENAIGRSFRPYVHPEDVHICDEFLNRVLKSRGRLDSVEYRVLRADGTYRWHASTGSALLDEAGRAVTYVGVARDVTAEKEARKLALQTEKYKAVADLTSGVAHNFNNLLQIVLGSTDLALMDLDSRDLEALRERLVQIRDSSKFGAETVRRLRRLARDPQRSSGGQSELFDLSEVAEYAVAMSKPWWHDEPRTKGVTISLNSRLQPGCVVLGNKSEIFEVIVNLIRNATEALLEGGRIDIETFFEGESAILKVSDTGIGIPREHLSRLFTPFFTTRADPGRGLGLATCRAIVDSHDGHILVDSEEGRGTTFTIRLPPAREASDQGKPAPVGLQ